MNARVFDDGHTRNDDLGETQNSTEVDWIISGLGELSTVNVNHQHSSIFQSPRVEKDWTDPDFGTVSR